MNWNIPEILSIQHPSEYQPLLQQSTTKLCFIYDQHDDNNRGELQTFLNIASFYAPKLRVLVLFFRSDLATSLPHYFMYFLHRWTELVAVAFDADLEGTDDIIFLCELNATCKKLHRELIVLLNRRRVLDNDFIITLASVKRRCNHLHILLLDGIEDIRRYLSTIVP